MENLLEQLEDNKRAIRRLEEREYDIKMGNWAWSFKSTEQRIKHINWNRKVQRRVLSFRHRILENIRVAALKEQQQASATCRDLVKQYQQKQYA